MDIRSRKKTYYLTALLTTLLLTACGAGQFFWVITLTDNLELLDSKPALLDTITDDEGYSYYINYDQQPDSVHTASLNKLNPSGEQLWTVDITGISTTSDNVTGAISLNGNIHIVIADNSNSQTGITWGLLSPEGDILDINQFSVQGTTSPSIYGLDELSSLLVYKETEGDNSVQKLDTLSTDGRLTVFASAPDSALSDISVSNNQITARQYANDDKSIVAFDFTGEEQWIYNLEADSLINWLIDNNNIYLLYQYPDSDEKNAFIAVDITSLSTTAQSLVDNDVKLQTVTDNHSIVFTRKIYNDISKKSSVFLGLLNLDGTTRWETELTSTIADVTLGSISTNSSSEIALSIRSSRATSVSDFEADILFKNSIYVLSTTSEILWSSHSQSTFHTWGDLGDVSIAAKSSYYQTKGISLDDNGNLYSHGMHWKKSTMPEVSAQTSYIGQIRP